MTISCAYCGGRDFHNEHVLATSLIRHYGRNRAIFTHLPPIPTEWLIPVRACKECNWRKLTLRLVPPSWADRTEAMTEFFGGTAFRVYEGGPVP